MADRSHILIASDLSARSDRSLERALLLADQLPACVILLHVVDRADAPTPDELEHLRELIRADLGAAAAGIEIVLAHGSVPSTIARTARQRHCRMIVTGVARFNSPIDFVLGTSVDFLVRHASVPVLVVRRRPHGPYRRLLVLTDFSACSREAVLAAAALFPSAEMSLLHVYHSAYEAWLDAEETARSIGREAQAEMEVFVASLPAALRDRMEFGLERGELQETVRRRMREGGFDLLVVGAHGRSGFAHATIGSRASEMLNGAVADVLVVRRSGE